MAKIICNNGNLPAWNCNAITRDVEFWLVENVGRRWHEWNWISFGYVEIFDDEKALAFKLKFGLW